MRHFSILLLVAFAIASWTHCCAAEDAATVSEDPRFFQDRIVPLLYEKCFCCHGGALVEGGYSVASTELLFKPGDSGIVPISSEKPDASELLVRMTAQDPTVRMPLDSFAMEPAEVDAVRKWIADGAKIQIESQTKSLLELYGNSNADIKSPDHYLRPIPISSLLLSHDGKNLLVSGYCEVLAWNLEQEAITHRIATRGRMIADLQWAPGGKLVIASGTPGTFGALEVFDHATLEKQAAFGFSRDVCSSLASSAYRNEIAAGFADGSVTIYSLDTYSPRISSVAHAAGVTRVYWSNRGDRLFSASLDRSAKSFESDNGQLLFAYADHERSVGGIVDTPYGPVTLDETGAMRIWSEGEETRTIAKQDGFEQVVQKLLYCNGILLVADKDRIRRISISQDEVDDDKAKDLSDSEKPKKKKRTRFKEIESLQSVPNQHIVSLTTNSTGLVAAGFANGQVVLWRMSESTKPWKTCIVKP